MTSFCSVVVSVSLTSVFERAAEGSVEAQQQLVVAMYDELRRLARRELGGREAHTLQPTALVHEALLRLGRDHGVQWIDRPRFLALAAKTMRRLLVDHKRKKHAAKRPPPNARVELVDEITAEFDRRAHDLEALDEALDELSAHDPALASLVESRFFGGMTMRQCAQMLEVSEREAFRMWQRARAWLRRRIGDD